MENYKNIIIYYYYYYYYLIYPKRKGWHQKARPAQGYMIAMNSISVGEKAFCALLDKSMKLGKRFVHMTKIIFQ